MCGGRREGGEGGREERRWGGREEWKGGVRVWSACNAITNPFVHTLGQRIECKCTHNISRGGLLKSHGLNQSQWLSPHEKCVFFSLKS